LANAGPVAGIVRPKTAAASNERRFMISLP
jgi:hypothetical protein